MPFGRVSEPAERASEPAGRGFEQVRWASELLERASKPAERASESAGKPAWRPLGGRDKLMETKMEKIQPVGHRPL